MMRDPKKLESLFSLSETGLNQARNTAALRHAVTTNCPLHPINYLPQVMLTVSEGMVEKLEELYPNRLGTLRLSIQDATNSNGYCRINLRTENLKDAVVKMITEVELRDQQFSEKFYVRIIANITPKLG